MQNESFKIDVCFNKNKSTTINLSNQDSHHFGLDVVPMELEIAGNLAMLMQTGLVVLVLIKHENEWVWDGCSFWSINPIIRDSLATNLNSFLKKLEETN